MMVYVLIAIVVLACIGIVFFRTVKVSGELTKPEPNTIGLHKFEGGAKIVFESDDVAKAMAFIIARIEETPRTYALADGVYLTRSAFWGFPDIAQVWSEGNTIHIYSHLVYGRRDLGVNRQKILDWIEGLN